MMAPMRVFQVGCFGEPVMVEAEWFEICGHDGKRLVLGTGEGDGRRVLFSAPSHDFVKDCGPADSRPGQQG